MAFAVFMTLPGLALLLTGIAFLDLRLERAGRAGMLPWRWNGRKGQMSSTGFEQLHASFSPGKQNELKERQSALIMRDDEEDGAPPRSRVHLDAMRAVIRMPAKGGSGT
ncbi:DUF6191 domain-containing protein [Streptomyces sp. H34-S4]|uniref:DUF6191 domain-containing protein n=1 Tax=Streptomyces sp. H34-S4 TaxID=2996463 RepID=UPI00227221C8|nr:DUF6191 domain-containing protein [Streptomyces sp. H34-S4]MCY0936426.1 DUF6191 domain-containing protein [Streptomyces sp. H34-S4]